MIELHYVCSNCGAFEPYLPSKSSSITCMKCKHVEEIPHPQRLSKPKFWDAPKPEVIIRYDIMQIAQYMDNKGHLPYDEFMGEYVGEQGYGNDSTFYLHFTYYSSTDKAVKYERYFRAMKEYLGLPEETEGIHVELSW